MKIYTKKIAKMNEQKLFAVKKFCRCKKQKKKKIRTSSMSANLLIMLIEFDEFFKATLWKSDSKSDHARFLTLKIFKEITSKELCWGDFSNLGIGYELKSVFDILSYKFVFNFKFSRINKFFFLVRWNSAVSLLLILNTWYPILGSEVISLIE